MTPSDKRAIVNEVTNRVLTAIGLLNSTKVIGKKDLSEKKKRYLKILKITTPSNNL